MMTTPTHPHAVTRDGRDLFDPNLWSGLTAPREPETSPVLLDLAAPHDATLREALDAYEAATAATAAHEDEALDLCHGYAASVAAWHGSAASGASKAPKAPDLDGTAFRLAALYTARDASASAAIRASRAVDAAAPAAVGRIPAEVRDALVVRLRTAHADAVQAVTALSVAVGGVEAARSTLGTLDVATLQALGVPAASALQVYVDRLPRVESTPTPSLPLLTADTVEALVAPLAPAVAAYEASQRPRGRGAVVAVSS